MKGQALIDWFTFSVKETVNPDTVISNYLQMEPDLFQKNPFGGLGYLSTKSFNGIMVFYEPSKDKKGRDRAMEMGVCVSMSGSGCRTFEAHTRHRGEGTPFWGLVALLHVDPLVNVSRVDLAVDDRGKVLDLDTIACSVRENTINSRIRKRNIQEGYEVGDRAGMTIYFGGPQSSFRIRVYDKAKEHFAPGQPGYDDHWVRFEMVMRGDSANGLIANMANSSELGKLACGILNDKLSFIERDDSNISRCTVCAWWLEFLESLEEIKLLSREETLHHIDRVFDWVLNQIAPSLSLIRDARGVLAIQEILRAGQENRTSKQAALLEDYRNAYRVAAPSV